MIQVEKSLQINKDVNRNSCIYKITKMKHCSNENAEKFLNISIELSNPNGINIQQRKNKITTRDEEGR